MTTPKRRRTGRRRAATSRSRRARRTAFTKPQARMKNLEPIGSYRPRDRLSPANMVDSVDRHVSRATETDESLERYLKLLRFARSTTLAIGILLIIGCILFGAGIAAAVTLAGLPPWVAIGIGAGGVATAIIMAILKASHHLKASPAAATDPLT